MIAELDDVLWAAKRPEELLEAKQALESLRSEIAAVDVELAVEIAASGAATAGTRAGAWASTEEYLTAVAGGRRGTGKRLLRTARALTTDRTYTFDALRDGDISGPHSEVIVAAIENLPADPALRDRAEEVLVEQAASMDATGLSIVAKGLLELLDPDGSERREERALDKLERSAHLNRELVVQEDGLGGVRLRGRGTVEDAAVIKAALFPLTAPQPNCDNSDDPCDQDRDPRDQPTRMWDALVATCQAALDAETLPECHGAKPRVSVTIPWSDLCDPDAAGTDAGLLETGERVSVATVRRLACDAEVIPVVFDGASVPLDLGRLRRLVSAALWRALVVRDRHCTFPGCTRPPILCHAHHIWHWADGGPTAVDNLALLCGTHHRLIHDSPWEIRLNPDDRRPEFLPPPIRGRDREWIRSRCPRAPE